ncbi:MAG: D-glycero-beta-D-manno-heptose-7-phosphate kinase, partial [Actinomycetia bacterium]|nr:D-glycero-beta-D-manno-heptose-7-phosphate kinase [Actinomycetes bacterium]
NVERINPEAPVPVVHVQEEYIVLGGAGNVISNIVSLQGKPVICSVIGNDPSGKMIRKKLRKIKVPVQGLFVDNKRPTITKTRIIAVQQHVVRIDREKIFDINQEYINRIFNFIKKNINEFDAIILSDYAKGIISTKLAGKIISLARKYKKIITVDPKPVNFNNYRGVTMITPNISETKAAYKKNINTEQDLIRAGIELRKKYNVKAFLITRGSNGMALFMNKQEPIFIETLAQEVYDVTGAGDTVISAYTLALAAGASFITAAMVANMAAGIVVGKRGTATATIEELKEFQKEIYRKNENCP